MGAGTLAWMARFGQFWRFAGRAVAFVPSAVIQRREWVRLLPQFYEIGVRTVPVMVVTGVFVGLVLAAQAVEQLRAANLEERMGVLVNLALIKELGPVLAGVMLAGRVGGALTAELGTMNVTEQLDALRVMGTDPIRHLVVPRFAACVLLAPVLTLYCDLMGAWGGWFMAVLTEGVPSEPYAFYTADAVETWDLMVGLIKSVVFGGSIGLISCFMGFHCRAGAAGVGRACTSSFVLSFLVILITDYFLTCMLQDIYKAAWGFKPLI